jgi:hypothetical protein
MRRDVLHKLVVDLGGRPGSMTKKPLKKPEIHQASFGSFMGEFVGESDRAAVILGAAMVERLLGQILEKHLLPSTGTTDELLEGDSPLATFSAKIKACHRLGILDDRFISLLNTFRRLRNNFAHETGSNTLGGGAARDRVSTLAEPFSNARIYQSLAARIANVSKRDMSDSGVTFRAVLAIFHLELGHILEAIEPIKPSLRKGIVENALDAIPPEDREGEASRGKA